MPCRPIAGFSPILNSPQADKCIEKMIQKLDQSLGRLLLRFFAVLALLASAGGAVFGAIVFRNWPVQGILLWLLAALFLWLGRRAWRDRAGLGELLNRDFAPMPKRNSNISGDSKKPGA